MYSYFLFALLIASSVSQALLPFCTLCKCENDKDRYDVTCSTDVSDYLFNQSYWQDAAGKPFPYNSLKVQGSKITTLEGTFVPSNITFLNLEMNSIVNISDGVFKNLQNLVTLVLKNNNIQLLHPDAFDGLYTDGLYRPLKSLKNLHLDYNKIHTLDQDIFEHTQNIQVLTMSRNPLKMIDHHTLIAISSLVYLTELDLSYTEISILPDGFLHTPKYLQVLDLSGNAFKGIPKTLFDSHNLTTLYFNDNALVNLTKENGFSEVSTLRSLHISDMKELTSIGEDALSGLNKLEELYCYGNPKLSYIDKNVLSSKQNVSNNRIWPKLTKLLLQNNSLSRVDMLVVGHWENLHELDLSHNPWICDCLNEWFIEELVPIYFELNQEKANTLKCAAPIEMAGMTFLDIYKKSKTIMRCLDFYGNRPERDGAMLVGILAGVLITIPLVLFIIYAYQRHWFGLFDSSPASYSRQFYQRTRSSEDGYF